MLWKAFKTGHRQDIRRGYKNGFVARFGGAELLEPFYEVHGESWRNLGTPLYSRHYFRAIARDASGDDAPAASSTPATSRRPRPSTASTATRSKGMWLGAQAKYRHQLVGYVLYWELIKHACEHGFTRFHLGRSTADSGSEAFKKKWNASVDAALLALPPADGRRCRR